MSIETPEELEHLKVAGRVVAQAIRAMRNQVRPGITTGELDLLGARALPRPGRDPVPASTTGFLEPTASASTTKPSTASRASGDCARVIS